MFKRKSTYYVNRRVIYCQRKLKSLKSIRLSFSTMAMKKHLISLWSFGGIMLAKVMNIFSKKNKINPMIGASGISAFPMSARVVHKMGLAEDPQNFLLMHSIGVNVSGQIASVIAGGLILTFVR